VLLQSHSQVSHPEPGLQALLGSEKEAAASNDLDQKLKTTLAAASDDLDQKMKLEAAASNDLEQRIADSAHPGSGGSGDGGSGGSGLNIGRSKWCNGVVTSMHMSGFASVFSADRASRPCVVFLMSRLVMDTPKKFLIGCVTATGLGVLTGALLAMRRLTGGTTCSFVCVQLPLYALTLFLGYLDMLLVMAYNLELILAVILGLTFGHAMFSRLGVSKNASEEGATPCCVNNTD